MGRAGRLFDSDVYFHVVFIVFFAFFLTSFTAMYIPLALPRFHDTMSKQDRSFFTLGLKVMVARCHDGRLDGFTGITSSIQG
jgi:hypothetical protein